MEQHLRLTDAQFEHQFENCTLDPALFSHEAHLRLAWIHIKKYGSEKACLNVCQQIRKFDNTFGKGDKFHNTLTVAAVKAVYHFTLKSKSNTFSEFITEFPRLSHSFKDLIETHYGFDVFRSKKAKHSYLEPDLVPFD